VIVSERFSNAGGLPIGAVLMRQHVADAMAPGDHGSTFAGNPLVCAAAVATFDIVNEPNFLAEVERKGRKLRQDLRDVISTNACVKVPWPQDLFLVPSRGCGPDKVNSF
jgi:acetylornithine aminotransferase